MFYFNADREKLLANKPLAEEKEQITACRDDNECVTRIITRYWPFLKKDTIFKSSYSIKQNGVTLTPYIEIFVGKWPCRR